MRYIKIVNKHNLREQKWPLWITHKLTVNNTEKQVNESFKIMNTSDRPQVLFHVDFNKFLGFISLICFFIICTIFSFFKCPKMFVWFWKFLTCQNAKDLFRTSVTIQTKYYINCILLVALISCSGLRKLEFKLLLPLYDYLTWLPDLTILS